MANPLDRLLAPTEAPATTYRWGHVVDPARPIQVILDNETEPIEAATLTGASLGDRVLVALNGRRATILGKAGGARLEDLANVSTTAPSTGDRLRFDGSEWKPEAPVPDNHVRINGVDYQASGSFGAHSVDAFSGANPYYASISLDAPYTPPSGYGFIVHVQQTARYAVVSTLNANADPLTALVIQVANSNPGTLYLGWRLVKTT